VNKSIRITILAAFIAAVLGHAQEENCWRLSLGVSYRTFDDVDFEQTTFAAQGNNYANGNYTDGGNYTIQDDSQLQVGGWTFDGGLGLWTRTASFDRTTSASSSEDADDSTGVVFELERDMWQPRENVDVSLLLGFGFFQSDADMNGTTTTTTLTGMLTSPVDPGAGNPPMPDHTVVGGAGFFLIAPLDLGDVATTTAIHSPQVTFVQNFFSNIFTRLAQWFADATNVKLGRITSPPIPMARTATYSADVHEFIVTAWPLPIRSANAFSNSAFFGPCASQPEASTSLAAVSSSSPMSGTHRGIGSMR